MNAIHRPYRGSPSTTITRESFESDDPQNDQSHVLDGMVEAKLNDYLARLDLSNTLEKSARIALETIAEQDVLREIKENQDRARGAE